MSAPLVWAVVAAWGPEEDTAACLAALLASAYGNLRVAVVTSGSAAGLARRFPAATFLEQGRDLGFTAASNVGLRHALARGAQFALLVSNDAVVDPLMVAALVASAGRHPAAGILGAKVLERGNPARIWALGARARPWMPAPQTIGAGENDGPRFAGDLRVDYVSACGMLLRRALLERVGLLDERFPMYYEDSDLCRRASAAGFDVLAVGGARLYYAPEQTARYSPAQSLRWRIAGRLRFYRGYRRAALPGLSAAWLTARTLVDLLQLAPRRPALVPHYLAGLRDGLRG